VDGYGPGLMEPRPLALLSLQSALLGMVTPDLRAVEVWVNERSVRAEFAYDGAVGDKHRELVAEVETLVIADLPDDVRVEFVAVAAPQSQATAGVVRDSVYAFLRKE
jgi:carbohydrate-binding DOMON domain-containing protein